MTLALPRALGPEDLDEIDRIRPQEWPPYRETFEHYFTTSCCQPYGLVLEGRLAATGTLIGFGRSAWIAQLITASDLRNKGLGTAMLNFLLQRARDKGLLTVSLVATAQGQPLYTRSGFRVEGEYGFFHRAELALPASDHGPVVVPWSERDSEAIAELDEQATGERRGPYWSTLQAGGWSVYEGDELTGFWLPRAGEGVIVARTAAAGSVLLQRRLQGSDRVVVPLENPIALQILAAHGFKEVRRAKRMVMGPSLGRNPALVWSRIGGNLG